MLVTFRDVQLTVLKATVIGLPEVVSVTRVDDIYKEDKPATNAPKKSPRRRKMRPYTKSYYMVNLIIWQKRQKIEPVF